jgi:predicted nucleic acid-binding protein
VKVLVDTNVVLDVLLDRRPHSTLAAQILGLAEQSRIEGLLCATTVTTLDYLLTQALSRADARRHLGQLLKIFEIAPVNRAVIDGAMKSRMSDFEDAVLERAAQLAGAEAIVTRDAKDFTHAEVPVVDPRELLAQLSA